jgi:hypothetical protein
VDVIFIALPLQDHKGCIFYKKCVVARKCLRNGGVNPECRTYYSDQGKNADGLNHADVLHLSDGRAWIRWKGITSNYSSDVLIEVKYK